MPTFDYKCTDCGATYDVFHKVREVEEDIICPSCSSHRHMRLMSAPNFSVSGRSSVTHSAPRSSEEYGGGCCGGGACGLN